MNNVNFFPKNCKHSLSLLILNLGNFIAVSLILLAFIFSYNSSWIFGFNFSLYSFFIGMFGIIVINLGIGRFHRNHLDPLLFAILIMILMFFLGMFKWLHNATNNEIELFKSSFFYIVCLLCLISIFYSLIFSKAGSIIIATYKKILVASSIFIILQAIIFVFWGLELYLPWQKTTSFFRPSGFFVEPAYFGHFSLGLLFLSRRNFCLFRKKIYLIFLGLILSFSTVSFLIFLILLYRLLSLSRIYEKVYLTFFCLIFSIGLFLSTDLPQTQRIMSSLGGGASFQSRVYKGPAIFSNLSLEDALLGSGPGLLSVTIEKYQHTGYYDLASSNDYMNGFFAEFVAFGLFGGLLLNLFYLSLFMRSDDSLFKYFFFTAIKFGAALNLTSPITVFLLILLVLNPKE